MCGDLNLNAAILSTSNFFLKPGHHLELACSLLSVPRRVSYLVDSAWKYTKFKYQRASFLMNFLINSIFARAALPLRPGPPRGGAGVGAGPSLPPPWCRGRGGAERRPRGVNKGRRAEPRRSGKRGAGGAGGEWGRRRREEAGAGGRRWRPGPARHEQSAADADKDPADGTGRRRR